MPCPTANAVCDHRDHAIDLPPAIDAICKPEYLPNQAGATGAVTDRQVCRLSR